jgi:radical SAM superfamily enzyme YgiQ (UPF0313 family)
VKVVDAAIDNLDIKEIKKIIEEDKPKLLGVSAATYTYKNALKIADVAKKIDSDIFTVLGGPHVTFTADKTLEQPMINVVVRGEGEYILLDLMKALAGKTKLKTIAGISYKSSNTTKIHNPDRPYNLNLDALPFPARDLFSLSSYKIPASIITSRGCPYNCVFCAAKALSGGQYRIRSPENVISEVKLIYKTISPDFIFIADDTFTVFHDRTKKIANGFHEMGIRWICESRVNTINKELISLLADSGCFSIQFGVESGSQKILDSIKKGITIKQVKKAIQWCFDSGIQPVCSFLVPTPEDTWETIHETEKFMKELKKLGVQIFVSLTTPFPGTPLYDDALRFGIQLVTDNTDDFNLATPIIKTKHFSLDDIEEIFELFAEISVATLPEAYS